MKQHWHSEELVLYWTLSKSELELLGTKTGASQTKPIIYPVFKPALYRIFTPAARTVVKHRDSAGAGEGAVHKKRGVKGFDQETIKFSLHLAVGRTSRKGLKTRSSGLTFPEPQSRDGNGGQTSEIVGCRLRHGRCRCGFVWRAPGLRQDGFSDTSRHNCPCFIAFGQILKSIFFLRVIDEPVLRMSIEKVLSGIEHVHAFTRAVSVGNPREFLQAEKEGQEMAEACKRLIKNCIICWNYLYLSQKLAEIDEPAKREELLQTMAHGLAAA